MSNSFKESLAFSTDSKFNSLMSQYKIMTENPEYFNFTCNFFADACKKRDEIFSGIYSEDKGRIKGKNSFEKKAKKSIQSEVTDSNTNIYDIFGAKTVILKVDSNCSENLSIAGYISRRDLASDELENAKIVKEKEKNSNDNFNIIEPYLDQIIADKREKYEICKDICETKVSEKLFDFYHTLPHLPEFQKYGLYIIKTRDRDYNTADQYIAKHVTFGSSILPLWSLEWQFKSMNSYNIARNGEASHQNREGKKIDLPDSISALSEDDFAHYIIYAGDGKVHVAGTFENAYHKYQPCFKDNPKFYNQFIKEDFKDRKKSYVIER